MRRVRWLRRSIGKTDLTKARQKTKFRKSIVVLLFSPEFRTSRSGANRIRRTKHTAGKIDLDKSRVKSEIGKKHGRNLESCESSYHCGW